MKTTNSTLTKIALGLLIAGSITACNNKPAATTAAATTPASDEKQTIVYLNSDTLLTKYQYAIDMRKRLNDKGTSTKSELESKEQAFQREVADYQKDAAGLAADKRQATEQRLGREKQELQQYEQNASAQFQNEQASEQSKLYDKIAEFSKAYAKEKGYKMVLSYSKGGPTIVYADPAMDVTVDALKRLNDAYAKDKK
ncbi:MAG: OmpH family outer membrane protein [Mucilaginibacter sp.]